MGLFNKIKNILFEEEVIEEPIQNEEKKIVETKSVDVERKPRLFDIEEDIPKVEEPKREVIIPEESERNLLKSERTFNFPLFDEEEFESSVPKMRSTNVLSREEIVKEKPVRKPEKKVEYPRYERIERPEEKKKFKPSPIISPVYGILDKDYSKEDILPKKKDTDIPRRSELTIESVRKKAFGDLEDEIEKTITKPREEFFEEVEQELDYEEKKPELIKEEKVDIEELLKDSAHEEIIVPEEDDFSMDIDDIEMELEKLDEELEKEEDLELEQLDKNSREIDEDDTLEQDLFELIDSMYDDRKEA